MDKNLLKSYRIIGQISNVISKVDSFDEAIKSSLRIILDNCAADYAVIWYVGSNDKEHLKPYYWISPVDLSKRSYKVGSGPIGKAYKNKSSEVILDFQKKPVKSIETDFKGIEIASCVCAPFEFGVVEFIKTTESGPFTEDEAEICQMLTLLTEISINENIELPDDSANKKVILSVSDIKREFQNGDIITKVLKGVNFDVFEGEFLCLLGESGCGKSTMLNIIGGMDSATSGTIKYLDQDLSTASKNDLTIYRRDNIGFIFQSYNLMPNLNIKQNLDLIAELVKEPRDSEEVLKLVHMDEKARNYPSELSGGQQQRVSIARALVKNPKVILADEPTAALDYATSIEVLTALEDVVASGTTLVMVTHNEEITRMANRVIRFRDGKVYEVTINHHPVKATELVW